LLELEERHRHWAELAGISSIVTGKSISDPAREAVRQIQRGSEAFGEGWKQASCYLTGRARSVQAVRTALLAKGISMKNIQTEPYWAEGKQGL